MGKRRGLGLNEARENARGLGQKRSMGKCGVFRLNEAASAVKQREPQPAPRPPVIPREGGESMPLRLWPLTGESVMAKRQKNMDSPPSREMTEPGGAASGMIPSPGGLRGKAYAKARAARTAVSRAAEPAKTTFFAQRASHPAQDVRVRGMR